MSDYGFYYIIYYYQFIRFSIRFSAFLFPVVMRCAYAGLFVSGVSAAIASPVAVLALPSKGDMSFIFCTYLRTCNRTLSQLTFLCIKISPCLGRAAANYVVDNYVRSGMVVGLGTGALCSLAIERIGK